MNVLGVDFGEKRIGLSFGDSLGLAVPLSAAVQASESARVDHIRQVIRERTIERIVVGMPYNMDGSIGFKAKEVEVFIEKLKQRFGLPVETVDERLPTHQVKEEAKFQKRKVDRKSGEVDSRAATLILQDFLDKTLRQNLQMPEDLSDE